MRTSSTLSLAASIGSALAQYKGFNYGSTAVSGAAFVQADFESQFNTAKDLVGTSGFTSARLYTMVQAGTSDTVISAIPAAINSQTSLLLGLWGSGGAAGFASELTALKNAISQYGSQMAPLLVGISVGSEDLYRSSSLGAQAGSTLPGAEPSTLVDYISQVRDAIAGTALSGAKIGHVDTWTSWVNGSNSAVVDACDWIGMDAYPYFQNTQVNPIEQGAALFSSALSQTESYSQGKPVWVTETGYPVSGPTENQAVANVANAKTYWDDVGCDLLFGKTNTWWYTLQDYGSSPSFGVVGQTLSTTPLYNLSCSAVSSSTSSASSTATSSATVGSATVPTTVPVSATSSVVKSPIPGPSLSAQSSVVSGSASASAGSATGSASASVGSATGSATGSVSASVTPVTGYASSSAGVSTTVSAVTTGSTTSVVAGGKTLTIYQTTLVTITSCPTACPTTMSTASGTVPASTSASASSTTSSAKASGSACPADIEGSYQYPHLIVPVSSSSPNTAYGTQYNGTVNATVSTIFNFDIPASYAGKTCSLVFLFPELSQLETSAYTFNNQGGLISNVLAGTANASTTYANAPKSALENGSIASLESGNSYVISSDSCPAGTAVSFELSSTGGLALEFFEDYNPSPLGLYVRAC